MREATRLLPPTRGLVAVDTGWAAPSFPSWLLHKPKLPQGQVCYRSREMG